MALSELKKAADARFEAVGFPTGRDEAWCFTSPRAIAKTHFAEPTPVSLSADQRAMLSDLALDDVVARIVFVDGRVDGQLSQIDAIADVEGLELVSIEDVATLGEIADLERDGFTALNTARFAGGAALRVANKADVGLVELLFVGTERELPAASHPRVHIALGRHSRVSVLERYVSLEGANGLTNVVTEVDLGEGATLSHTVLQEAAPTSFHVSSLSVRQGRDSQLRSFVFQMGAQLGRAEVHVELAEPGASCELDGLYVGKGKQKLDCYTVIDHVAPRCSSRETYKGIMSGKASGAFQGRVLIREGAAGSATEQMTRSLMLNEGAQAHSRPQLEIDNDDVTARHGSTIGQLDPLQVHYLRTRGIDKETAEHLLTWAFAREVVEMVRVPQVKALVASHIASELGAEMALADEDS